MASHRRAPDRHGSQSVKPSGKMTRKEPIGISRAFTFCTVLERCSSAAPPLREGERKRARTLEATAARSDCRCHYCPRHAYTADEQLASGQISAVHACEHLRVLHRRAEQRRVLLLERPFGYEVVLPQRQADGHEDQPRAEESSFPSRTRLRSRLPRVKSRPIS